MNRTQEDRSQQWGKRALDVALGVGLVVAVVAVFVFSRDPSAVTPPDTTPPLLVKAEIPPMPFIPFTFADGLTDKVPPPLPPLPPEEDDAPPPNEKAVDTNEVKAGNPLSLGFSGIRQFGLTVKKEGDKVERRLTLNEYGQTNHTMVFAGPTAATIRDALFFDTSSGTIVTNLAEGEKFTAPSSAKGQKSTDKEVTELAKDGPYVMSWNYQGVVFEQRLEYVPGEVTREMDTVLVSYTMTNMNRTPYRAGLRLMIDTFIGNNDGVPFYVPGKQGVIDTPTEFKGKDVPTTLFALEKDDLTDAKMTVVQMGFGGQGNEKPGRLVLSQWPGDKTVTRANPDEQYLAILDVPATWPLSKTFEKDSAVGLFYYPKEIKPKGSRTFSFTYGLGSLSSGKSRNATLALAPAGPFVAGQSFRLTALVKDPTEKQAIKLTLPDGMKLAEGETVEKVVEAKSGVKIAKADWEVVIAPEVGGKQTVRAQLVGTDKAESVTIFVENPNPVLHSVTVTGLPTPGGLVRVTATVLKPKTGMTATLVLPKGARLETTRSETQKMSAGKAAQPNWLVRLDDTAAGEMRFSVSTTAPKAELSATALVTPPKTTVAGVRVDGQPQSDGVLRVTAQVVSPKDGSTLTLQLPDGFTMASGETAEKALTAGRVAQLSWLVSLGAARTGDATVTVRLSPGGEAVNRTVKIEAAKPVLEVRRADEVAVTPGKPLWVVARVFHSPDTTSATVTLPKGMKLLDGHRTTKTLEAKTTDGFRYSEAAWPMVLDEYTDPSVTLVVSAGPWASNR